MYLIAKKIKKTLKNEQDVWIADQQKAGKQGGQYKTWTGLWTQ